MPIAYLSLGSNMGDRLGNIQRAVSVLSSNYSIKVIRTSAFYETEPWGNKNQAWFVNACIEISTKLSPKELLSACFEVEKILGRVRDENTPKWSSRTIDIDIIFYDDLILNEPDLTIPHKYMHQRAFVLVPLLELIADYKHPKFNITLEEMYYNLETLEDVYLYGTRYTSPN